MTTYRGFDVLEVEPDWPDDLEISFRRRLDKLDNGMAPAEVRDYGGRNFGSMPFRWWCGSRSEVQAFRDFLDARKGRVVPFWMPSWLRDFSVVQAANSSDMGLVVNWRGYADRVFGDLARRDIAIILPTGIVYRRITGTSQTATAETLTLNASLGVAVPVGSLVSFLLLCRLDTDEPEITWETDSHATIDMPVVEIPKEVP